MSENHFDQFTRNLDHVANRRGVLRFAGTAAAVGTLVAIGSGQAVTAKKKGKNKKKKGKKQQVICQPGQSVGSVSVPATGATVSTPVLAQGQRYRLRASGFWSTNATYGNDAFAAFPYANPGAPETTYQGVRLGLAVNGESPDQWGSYTTAHVYERQVTGQGTALSLRFTDPQTNDNSGSLLVDIFCA